MDQSLKGSVSALSCFPPSVGRDVAVAVVKPLAACLGNPSTHNLLRTDRQVKWTMEVLCYGLTLPLDRDIVKLCVDVYTDWMMALVCQRSSTPPPISRDPNLYVQRILRHLSILFLPRSGQVSPAYLSLCQQVLGSVQCLAKESSVMSRDTWETLLHFLLRINHTLLASPNPAGVPDLSLAVLLEVWLLACSRCFPSRLLWQTFRQMFNSWRHQPAVVDQWSRVTAGLTSRLLPQMFGPLFPHYKVPDEDASLVPADMEDECVSQTWFKFLNLFSNPVDLINPAAGSSQDEVFDRGDAQLPGIFFRAMRAVSDLVNAFLGVTKRSSEETEHLLTNTGLAVRSPFRDRLPSLGFSVSRSPFRDRLPPYGFSRPRSGSAPPTPMNFLSTPDAPSFKSSSPPHKRRLRAEPGSKLFSTSSSHNRSMTSSPLPTSCPPLCSYHRPSAHPLRCNVDSLLHLFGSWLFEAVLTPPGKQAELTVTSERWAAGRAEACGTLCRIFTCKKTAENIQSVYLSRFYLVLLKSLQEASPPVVVSVLLNSTSLFCCDLRGVNLLLPCFVSILETVLLDRDLVRFKGLINPVELRRSSIFILLSLMPLPLQFGTVQLQESVDMMINSDDATARKLLSYKPRLLSLLIGALQTETDTCNIQLLLAAMLNVIHDSAASEHPPTSPEPAQETKGQSGVTGGTNRTKSPTVQSEAAVLWIQVVRLLTQRLTSQWRSDSAVCLSALEVLGGLAKVEVQVEDSERRRAVGSVCTYIVFQCGRPPPLHSRDLHSIIVAAFCCLNIWLSHHPALLHQQECLLEVLEIVELGISGSKSRQNENFVWKEDKDLNPASLRVKEAAEATLSCIMQVSGVFTCLDGSLREESLLLNDSSINRSRHFALEGPVILSMLEPTPIPDEEPSPSLMVIFRGPSGHHSWTLQLHLLPRDGRAMQQMPRPEIPDQPNLTAADVGQKCSINHPLAQENTERVPLVAADRSIPALSSIGPAEEQQLLEHLRATLKAQQDIEALPELRGHSVAMATCRPPPPISQFQATRLFLSHMGLLCPESVKDPGISTVQAALLSLDSTLPGFSESLRHLDQLPSRNSDCAFIFYMRAGQRKPRQILGNVEKQTSVSGHFLDFLSSLGWPEEVGRLQVGGASHSEFASVLGDSGGAVFDGRRFILRFADALTQITFIVPSSHTYTDWLKSYEEVGEATVSSSNRRRSETRPSEDTKSFQSVSSFFRSDSKLMIVWVECFEDIESFPLTDLLLDTNSSNVQLIFIHPLKTGLYSICFHGNTSSKLGLVVPLVNGMVTSRRSLGFLATEMVSNCSHRRRLESDSAPPPHVRRKHQINDIILRYKSRRSEPDFYSGLFHP